MGFLALIIAVQFQANWKSPSLFTALAVLYAVGLQKAPAASTDMAVFAPDSRKMVPALGPTENTAT
jgi:hypothetical protein